MGILYQKGRAIAEPLYAEMLAKDASCLEEFLTLFKNHLSLPHNQHEMKVIENLMRGLSIRLPVLIQNFETEKLNLLRAYRILICKSCVKDRILEK